jgi:hypothetical protein
VHSIRTIHAVQAVLEIAKVERAHDLAIATYQSGQALPIVDEPSRPLIVHESSSRQLVARESSRQLVTRESSKQLVAQESSRPIVAHESSKQHIARKSSRQLVVEQSAPVQEEPRDETAEIAKLEAQQQAAMKIVAQHMVPEVDAVNTQHELVMSRLREQLAELGPTDASMDQKALHKTIESKITEAERAHAEHLELLDKKVRSEHSIPSVAPLWR